MGSHLFFALPMQLPCTTNQPHHACECMMEPTGGAVGMWLQFEFSFIDVLHMLTVTNRYHIFACHMLGQMATVSSPSMLGHSGAPTHLFYQSAGHIGLARASVQLPAQHIHTLLGPANCSSHHGVKWSHQPLAGLAWHKLMQRSTRWPFTPRECLVPVVTDVFQHGVGT